MNQRLVESVAQIVLSMSEEERRLLGRNLQECGLSQWAEPDPVQSSARIADSAATDKSSRIAELAQDIQEFEELYHPPHHTSPSALPAAQWTPPGMPAEVSSLPVMLTPEGTTSGDASASVQSFFQLTQPFHSDAAAADDANLDYAVYAIASEMLSDVPGQNRRF